MQRSRCLVATFFLGALAAQNAAPQDPVFFHEFGTRGQPGSYRACFSDAGAGMVSLQLGDHYVDTAAGKKEVKGDDDLLLLVWAGNDFSFRVEEQPRQPVPAFFPNANLLTAAWKREILPAGADGPGGVRFSLESGSGLVFTKTFRPRPGLREIAVELAVRNTSDSKRDGNERMFLSLGGPALVNKTEASLFFQPAVAVGVGPDKAVKFLPPKAGPLQELLKLDGQELSMAGSTNRFFGGFVFPLDDAAKRAVLRVDTATLPPVDDVATGTKANTVPRVLLQLSLAVPKVGETSKAEFGFYLGPKSYHVFSENADYQRFEPILDHDLEPTCCVVNVPGGRLMATLLVKLLGFFQGFVHNWGIAIMMLTLLVRGVLAPLNFRMQKSMRAYSKRMAVLKPKLDELKEKYSDDQKRYQQEMLKFQREHKLMPPLGGCLPIFLTMPVYLGLFTALRTAYDLRHQPFLWMTDLSQPDTLASLPFWPHNFNLLPLLWMGMFVTLQLRMPLPTDPQQRQMQQMMRYMPILFGVGLYNYASGLMVYMVTSMLWTFVESAVIKKILGPIDPNTASLAPTPMM